MRPIPFRTADSATVGQINESSAPSSHLSDVWSSVGPSSRVAGTVAVFPTVRACKLLTVPEAVFSAILDLVREAGPSDAAEALGAVLRAAAVFFPCNSVFSSFFC